MVYLFIRLFVYLFSEEENGVVKSRHPVRISTIQQLNDSAIQHPKNLPYGRSNRTCPQAYRALRSVLRVLFRKGSYPQIGRHRLR